MSEIGLSLSDLDTPLLWVDLDLLEKNIAGLIPFFSKQWSSAIGTFL